MPPTRPPTLAVAVTLALTSAACGVARADGPGTPATRPTTVVVGDAPIGSFPPLDPKSARADTSTAIPADPTVDQVLAALHARGDDLRTLSADVAMTEAPLLDAGLGDEPKTRGGRLYVDRTGESPRVRVTFDRETTGGRTVAGDKLEYLLDGDTLTDRTYGSRKVEVRRQVRRAGDPPVDLLAVDGPLPLPVGQSPDEVKRRFEVSVVPPAPTDPPGTVHVRLVPREGTRLAGEFETLDLWPDRADALPRRVETADATTVRTTELSNVVMNAPLPEGALALEPVDEREWQITVQPLQPAE